MQEPSIRSFTLDYYRSLGAELTPLDARARNWEVRLGVGYPKPLNISFDPDPDSSQMKPMGRTTPQWREILEACTQARTVAYRHVVADPIANITQRFQQKLPSFGVRSTRMLSVKARTAVGFSHRITFDAPAMATRHEELHHDLVDALTGERLDALSEGFYTMHSIPIEAPQDPRHLAIEVLHAQAISWIDQRTEAKGYALEEELAPRLAEAETRIRQYYAGQIAQLLKDEEAELDAKLEYLVQRTQQTKLPGAIVKLQHEAEKVTIELEHIRVRRELEGEHVREAERARLEAERARHEITIDTKLVSLAYVTFDIVSYALTLAFGETTSTLEVDYVPVIDQLNLPDCPACGLAIALGEGAPAPGLQAETGTVVCHRCAPNPHGEASSTEEPMRKTHTEACARCGMMTPWDAVQRCHLTQTPYCVVCALTCSECGEVTSREQLKPNPTGRGMICPDHAIACRSCRSSVFPRETFTCPGCQDRHCQRHALFCADCGMPSCPSCLTGGCRACSQLQRVSGDHDLVQVVQGLYPSLKRFGMRWLLAEVGEFALLEWQAPLGRKGRLVVSVQDYFVLSARERGPFQRTWR